MTTCQHLSVLVGTNFSTAEYRMTRVGTYRYVADGLNPDL